MRPWSLFIFCYLLNMVVICPLVAGNMLRKYPMIRLILKGIGTLIAAALAGHGAAYIPNTASWLITFGLIICAAADIVINIRFLAGTCVFLIGHALYISAFLKLAPIQPTIFVLFIILCLIAILAFHGKFKQTKLLMAPYILYGAVLLFELSVALLLPAQIGLRGFMAAVGVLQFSISDLLIAKRAVKKSANHYSRAIMWLYYSAQLFISLVSLQPWIGV